jgi:hypothetical protein
MDTNGQHLAKTYLVMLNTHEPDLVNRRTASSGPRSSPHCPI